MNDATPVMTACGSARTRCPPARSQSEIVADRASRAHSPQRYRYLFFYTNCLGGGERSALCHARSRSRAPSTLVSHQRDLLDLGREGGGVRSGLRSQRATEEENVGLRAVMSIVDPTHRLLHTYRSDQYANGNEADCKCVE